MNYWKEEIALTDGSSIACAAATGKEIVLNQNGYSSMRAFDTETGILKQTDIPYINYHAQILNVNNTLYCTGYSTVETQMKKFDAEAKRWTPVGEVKLVLDPSHRCAVSGSKIYCFGRITGRPDTSQTTVIIDTETETIEYGAPLPGNTMSDAKATHYGVAALDNRIYLFGGKNMDDPRGISNKILIYDIATDSWSERCDLYHPTTEIATVVIGTRIYLLGGSRPGVAVSDILIYDTEQDTIQLMAPLLPRSASNSVGFSVDGKIYFVDCTNRRLYSIVPNEGCGGSGEPGEPGGPGHTCCCCKAMKAGIEGIAAGLDSMATGVKAMKEVFDQCECE